jgi:hypothetical protein
MISDVISGWILIADKFRHQDKINVYLTKIFCF